MLFPLGRVVATRGAIRALGKAHQSPYVFLDRHKQGDWGEVCAEDKQENDRSMKEGEHILSAYTTKRETSSG